MNSFAIILLLEFVSIAALVWMMIAFVEQTTIVKRISFAQIILAFRVAELINIKTVLVELNWLFVIQTIIAIHL